MTQDAPEPAPESRAVATSRELRRRRARRLALGFAIWVALPTAIAAIYYGLVATPRYQSIAVIAVESSERSGAPGDGLDSFLPHAASSRDLQIARDYVRSRAMLEVLVEEHGFVAHYADPEVDRWSRLPAGASREDTYDYFREVVRASSDGNAGTIALEVRAFSAERAHAFATAIVAAAERMMNELTARAWKDQLELGERAVAEARRRLGEAQAALLAAPPGTPPPEALAVDKDLAHRRLEAAALGLEQARADASRQRRYLIAVAPPSLPDAPGLPRRAWSVATVFVLALALAGVLSLLIAAVREHARF